VSRLRAADVATFCEKRMREVLDSIFRDEKMLRIVLRDARGLDFVVDRLVTKINDLLLHAIEHEIRAAQTLGVLRRDADPLLHAKLTLGGIEKVVLDMLAAGEPLDLDALVHEAVHLQLFGLISKEIRR
jgi:hypothetical protein